MRSNPNGTIPQRVAEFIPTGSLVTVTIGRNVTQLPIPPVRLASQSPLTPMSWTRFQNDVHAALADYADQIFGPFHGVGEWDGVTEDSAVLTALIKYPVGTGTLENILSVLAARYGQDAIAWSFGPGMLAARS